MSYTSCSSVVPRVTEYDKFGLASLMVIHVPLFFGSPFCPLQINSANRKSLFYIYLKISSNIFTVAHNQTVVYTHGGIIFCHSIVHLFIFLFVALWRTVGWPHGPLKIRQFPDTEGTSHELSLVSENQLLRLGVHFLKFQRGGCFLVRTDVSFSCYCLCVSTSCTPPVYDSQTNARPTKIIVSCLSPRRAPRSFPWF